MRLRPALQHLTPDGRNPRQFQFHRFDEDGEGNGDDDGSPMAQFVNFLLHHGAMDVCTIALSHNGV
jgi:hypothetical protein